ncbi:MAG: nitrilase-related carbon-nitrogen hydrolase [Microcoleaceae cyanobacterium]
MTNKPTVNSIASNSERMNLPQWLVQIAAPIISAGLFAFCFPPDNIYPLAFIAFTPLLFATLTAKNSWQARTVGFVFGCLVYSSTLRWMWNIFPWFTIILWAILALFPAIFTFTLFLIKRKWGLGIALITAPFIWIGIEYFRSECWFLKFAWITPGFSQAKNLAFLQFSSVLGVYGISALVIAVNCCICYLFLSQTQLKKRLLPVVLSIVIVGIIHTWGLAQIPTQTIGKIPVGAIQTEASILRENQQLSEQLSGKVKLIVWPEYSLFEYVDAGTKLFKKLSQIAIDTQAYLIVGAQEKVPDAPQKFYNTALLLSPTGEKIGSYHKNNPVQFMDDGIPGKNFPVFDTEIGKIGIAICYDMDFSNVFLNLVRNGAEILAVPTYDAMEWSEIQHLQHSAMAPARAIEHRRWVIRATSSGISQIINPYGEIQASLDVGLTGTISGKIEKRSALTFYANFGYLLAPICLVIVISYLGYELVLDIKKTVNEEGFR